MAKAFDGGEMAVTVFGAKICDLDDFLQRSGAADDLAEDGADGDLVKRSLVRFEDVLENFLFPPNPVICLNSPRFTDPARNTW